MVAQTVMLLLVLVSAMTNSITCAGGQHSLKCEGHVAMNITSPQEARLLGTEKHP